MTVSIGRNVDGTECKTSSRNSGRAPPMSENLEEKSTVGVRWSFWVGGPVCEPRGGMASSSGSNDYHSLRLILVVVDPSVKIVYLNKMIEITGLPTPVAWEWRELSTSTSTQGKCYSATV